MTPPGTFPLLNCAERRIKRRVYAVIIGFSLIVTARRGHDQCHELKASFRGAAVQGPLGEGAGGADVSMIA